MDGTRELYNGYTEAIQDSYNGDEISGWCVRIVLESLLAKGFRRVVCNKLFLRGRWPMTGAMSGMAHAAMGGGMAGGSRVALVARTGRCRYEMGHS
jgi:hypothetical protein